jgi:AraC family transcriptional regulator
MTSSTICGDLFRDVLVMKNFGDTAKGKMMRDVSEVAVLRAIDEMRARLGEQLTVDDLARAAMFSKFHFTRMFERVTGVSPGRFLSALRLQRAKELLVTTPMKVADISVSVGYNSVGTFSSRFSRSVGMSPTIYRRHAGYAQEIRPGGYQESRSSQTRLRCDILPACVAEDSLIFVGLFAGRIPEGRPVHCAVLRGPAPVVFEQPSLGSWYVHAQSVRIGPEQTCLDDDCADRPVAVASAGPVVIRPGTQASAQLALRPGGALDPPVLLALLDVRTYALSRLAATHAEPLARADHGAELARAA